MNLKPVNKSILNNFDEHFITHFADKSNQFEEDNILFTNETTKNNIHGVSKLNFFPNFVLKDGHRDDYSRAKKTNDQLLNEKISKQDLTSNSSCSSLKMLGQLNSENRFIQVLKKLEPCPFYSFNDKKVPSPLTSIGKMSSSNRCLTLPLNQIRMILKLNFLNQSPNDCQFFKIDSSNRHIALYDPFRLANLKSSQTSIVPKVFTFDAILNSQSSQHDYKLSKAVLPELINTVINGHNAVLISLGPAGTQETMFNSNGLLIYTLSWLFESIKFSKKRFKIKCTSVQVTNKEVIDLLSNQKQSSCKCLTKSKFKSYSIFNGLHKILCSNVKRAANCLDKVNHRYKLQESLGLFIFTIHLNQLEAVVSEDGKIKELSTRCKLHLLDFPSKAKTFLNILLGITKNEQQFGKDKLSIALKECLNSMLTCSLVSTNFGHSYNEIFETCHYMTSIYKSKLLQTATVRNFYQVNNKDEQAIEDKGNSDSEQSSNWYKSSSDHSIDTVIFKGECLPNMLKSVQSQNSLVINERFSRFVNTKNRSNFNQTSDELWIDSPKKSTKKKFITSQSEELWVDGPKAVKNEQSLTNCNSSNCNNVFNPVEIVQDLTKTHAKTFEEIENKKCDYTSDRNRSLMPSLLINFNPLQILNESSKDLGNKSMENNQVNNSYQKVNPDETQKTTTVHKKKNSICEYFEDEKTFFTFSKEVKSSLDDDKHSLFDVNSNKPLIEYPKQLKLEQFLKKLITITNPQITLNQEKKDQFESVTNFNNLIDQKSSFEIKNDEQKFIFSLNQFKKICDEERPKFYNSLPLDTLSNSSKLNSFEINVDKSDGKQSANLINISENDSINEGKEKFKNSIEYFIPNTPQKLIIESQIGSSGYDSAIQDDESIKEVDKKTKFKSIKVDEFKNEQKQKEKIALKKQKKYSTSVSSSDSKKCSLLCC